MKPLMGNGKRTAKVMFVVDNPTEEEYKAKRYFASRSGNLLIKALRTKGVDVAKLCYFTAVYKLPTPNNRQPVREEIYQHKGYLDAEIKVLNPDIIVPLGNVALKQIYGRVGITKLRGKAIEKDGKIIFPMIHPEVVFQQPKYAKLFARDIVNLAKIINEGNNKQDEHEYRYLETMDEIEAELKRLMDVEWVVFDLETSGLNPFLETSKIACISLTDRARYGVTIPLEHPESPLTPEELEKTKALLKQVLENPKTKKMAHNGKFDIKWLKVVYDIDVANFAFDPMLAHYLCVSEERGGHGLKDLTWEHIPEMGGYDNKLDEFKQTLPEKDRNNYCNIPWKILREYAAADVDCTFRLYEKFVKLLEKDEGWKFVFENLLIPASYMLRDLEINGIKLDKDRLKQFKKAYEDRMEEIERKLREFPEVVQIEREKHELYKLRQLEMKKPKDQRDPDILKYSKYKNFKFNFGSPNHLRELLFEKLGLETPFLTDKGEEKQRLGQELSIQDYSTGKETLEYLKDKHPIAALLAEWRRINKVYGTYISPAEEWIGKDELVHPTYLLTGTVTGRLASESPNAQNFPRKSNDPTSFEYKYGPKKLFVSRFGDEGLILQADYSQLELRIAAIFSGDPELRQAYEQGKDVHIYAASQVYGVPEDKVTKDQRTAAKAVNFGLLYGKGAQSLAVDMGVSVEEAQDFIDRYFGKFKEVKRWLDEMRDFVTKHKYVKTLTGRWRRLPGVDSNKRSVVSEAYRMCVNAPIQGTGSDCTLMALININNRLKEENLKSRLCITVHDSIVADVYKPELKRVYEIMKECMEQLPYDWVTVPLVAEFEVGHDYGTLVEYDPDEVEKYKDIDEYIQVKLEKEHEKLLKELEEKQKKQK